MKGLGVSPGVAIGRAIVFEDREGSVLYVPRRATYRISSDQRLWIDVVGPAGVVESSKFAMQTGCAKLVKSVAFTLDPEIGYWIQLTGSPVREPMLLITLDR